MHTRLQKHGSKSGSLDSSGNSPPSSPAISQAGSSPGASLQASPSPAFAQAQSQGFLQEVHDKNLARIKTLYVEFFLKIKECVIASDRNFECFAALFRQWYPKYWPNERNITGASRLELVNQIFDIGIDHLGWNNLFNCHFLLEAVVIINDPYVKEAKITFFKDRHAYFFTASIATYIQDNEQKIAQFQHSEDAKVLKQRDRLKKEYRATVTAKLKFTRGDMTRYTLQYLQTLWSELRISATPLLPEISTILDCIYCHCLCIRWIVLSQDVVDNIKFVVNVEHKEEYAEITAVFRKYRVVRFELDGVCLYSSEEESQPNDPSLSLTEEPHNEQSSNLEAETSTATLTAEDNNDPATRPESPTRLTEPPSDPGDELPSEPDSGVEDETQTVIEHGSGDLSSKLVPEDEEPQEGFLQTAVRVAGSFVLPKTVSQNLMRECKKRSADINKVQEYLEDLECNVRRREKDEFRWDPFMWACDQDHHDIAKLLLKYKPNMNLVDKKLWTPLVLAARAGDVDVVRGVVELSREQGLGPGYIDKHTNKNWTPLMWAAHRGHAKVVEYLLEQGAYVDFPDINGWTPLMQASQEGNADVVEILLAHGANPNHQVETTWSALMAAVKNKHARVADILLSNGAEVDLQRNDGSTALQVASYYEGNSEGIKLLLKYGAKVDHLSKDGLTALMIATERGYTDMVKTLMDGGADPNLQHKETRWTALFLAAKGGLLEVSKVLLDYKAKIEVEGRKAFEIANEHNKGRLADEFNRLYNEQPSSGKDEDSSVDPPEQVSPVAFAEKPLTVDIGKESSFWTRLLSKIIPDVANVAEAGRPPG